MNEWSRKLEMVRSEAIGQRSIFGNKIDLDADLGGRRTAGLINVLIKYRVNITRYSTMPSPPSPSLSATPSNEYQHRPLEGRLALITGASRGTASSTQTLRGLWLITLPGIGAAIAQNLGSKGCSLILNYNSPSSRAPASDRLVPLLQILHTSFSNPRRHEL